MATVRRKITNRILDMLERHERPWRLDYRPDPNCGQPRNVRTGGLYRGVNPILLNSDAQRNDLYSCWWGTSRDWRDVGATVQESALSVSVCVYKWRGVLGDLKEETVFNAEHVRGADKYLPTITEAQTFVDLDGEMAVKVIKGTKADIRVGVGDKNNPPTYCGYVYPVPYTRWPQHTHGDYILVPPLLGGRITIDEFLCNHFHELIHWAEIRTNFFDELAKTELVADMGSYYLAQECKIPPDKARAHYEEWRRKWIECLNQHDTIIFRLAAQTRRAVDYVLSKSHPARNDSRYHDCDSLTILPIFPKRG